MEGNTMPITYKVEILAALRDAGYTQNRIRNEKLIGQSYLTQLRHGELVSWKNLFYAKLIAYRQIERKTIETICSLLQCQPGDILEYSESGETK